MTLQLLPTDSAVPSAVPSADPAADELQARHDRLFELLGLSTSWARMPMRLFEAIWKTSPHPLEPFCLDHRENYPIAGTRRWGALLAQPYTGYEHSEHLEKMTGWAAKLAPVVTRLGLQALVLPPSFSWYGGPPTLVIGILSPAVGERARAAGLPLLPQDPATVVQMYVEASRVRVRGRRLK